MAECAKSVLRWAESGTCGGGMGAAVTARNDAARARSNGSAGTSSEEPIHSATSGWGGRRSRRGEHPSSVARPPELTKNPKRRSDPRFVRREVGDHAIQDLVQVHLGLVADQGADLAQVRDAPRHVLEPGLVGLVVGDGQDLARGLRALLDALGEGTDGDLFAVVP